MKTLAFALAGLVTCGSWASEWRPSDALLKAVRQVESNNGQQLYGDHGNSLGAFQMSEAAWLDVSSWRRGHGLKVYAYNPHVMHSYINRAYAADYLAMIHSELSRKLRRTPLASEIYAAYNMGLGNFAGCGYRLANVNPVTAKKARQVHALVARPG